MTDISNWEDSVYIEKKLYKDWQGEHKHLVERIMVPLNGYQMGNLIDALSQVQNTGDWYFEFCSIVARAMEIAGLKELTSNRGIVFSYEDVANATLKQD